MGAVSFAHRISGFLLFLAMPFGLYLMGLSLSSESGFNQTLAIVNSLPFQIVAFFLVWSLLHHLFAGIRYLLLDFDLGVDKATARASAIAVIVCGLVFTLLSGLLL